MSVNEPSPPSDEKRKGHRRIGTGRRTRGERRLIPMPAPPDDPDVDPKTRQKQRRVQKRRTLADRRSN